MGRHRGAPPAARPAALAWLICCLLGHRPERHTTGGHVDHIEALPTAARRPVAIRVKADVERCTRCGARRLVIQADPLGPPRPELYRWCRAW